MTKLSNKQLAEDWNSFFKANIEAATVDQTESTIERKKRVAKLEADPEAWFKYYFPAYATAEPAPFHKAATRRVLNNMEWYEVRAWSRELAKTTRTMMEVMYLALTGKKKNVILVSNSLDNAKKLLEPYKDNFEHNPRITNDYGQQTVFGQWEANDFKTQCGCAFRAIGAGQSPRGTKNKNYRPDVILVDDIDTDEECRNPEVIDSKWKWVEKALISTRSINNPMLVLFCGNIIAEYCCITEAIKKADKVDIVNIRTNGKSSWPQKNSEEHIERVLSKISFAAAQGEYFNNPITEGKVFKELVYDKVPPLKKFPFLVAYGDPSPSNNETKKNSYKALVLVGRIGAKVYVIKTFLEQTTNSNFVEWFYNIRDYVGNDIIIYNYIENNSLQDPFFEQVFKPLFFARGKACGSYISIIPDDRKKPDKFTRIEGTLEPVNRMGNLIFNEAESSNPHMQRLTDQFKAVSPTNKNFIDGADAVEGAVWITNTKIQALTPPTFIKRDSAHKNRF